MFDYTPSCSSINSKRLALNALPCCSLQSIKSVYVDKALIFVCWLAGSLHFGGIGGSGGQIIFVDRNK